MCRKQFPRVHYNFGNNTGSSNGCEEGDADGVLEGCNVGSPEGVADVWKLAALHCKHHHATNWWNSTGPSRE